jgi:hypothetical protein
LIAIFIEENLKKSSMSRQPERPPENEPFLFWHVRESASYSTTVVTFTRQLMTAFDHVDVGEKRVCCLGSLQTEKKKAEKTVELVLCFVKEKSASLGLEHCRRETSDVFLYSKLSLAFVP